MFDKYLNSIIHDKNTRMFVGAAVIIYIACFTDMIPNNIKKLLRQPIARMLVLAGIAYLSTINFEGALMVTIIYFATANCLSTNESFNNLLTPETEVISDPNDPSNTQTITYDGSDNLERVLKVKNMQQATNEYNEKTELLSSGDRGNLKLWGTDGNPCYKGAASTAAETAENYLSGLFGTAVGDTAAAAPSVPRCVDAAAAVSSSSSVSDPDGLIQVDLCADNNNTPYGAIDRVTNFTNQSNTFPSCGAAVGKHLKKVCKYGGEPYYDPNDNTKILYNKCKAPPAPDGDGTIKCPGGPDGLDSNSTQCKEEYLDYELQTMIGESANELSSWNLDRVKNTFLKNRPQLDEEGNEIRDDNGVLTDTSIPLMETITDSAGVTKEIPLVCKDGAIDLTPFNNQVINPTDLTSYQAQITWTQGDIPMIKLKPGFVYEYSEVVVNPDTNWDEANVDAEILNYDEKDELYYYKIQIKDANNQEIKATVHPFEEVSGEVPITSFYSDTPKIPVFNPNDSDQTAKYLDATGQPTNELESASEVCHPKFGRQVFKKEYPALRFDVFDVYMPKPPQSGGAVKKLLKQVNLYGGQDFTTSQELLNAWTSQKTVWENKTAKSIMRSIGCNRLRNPENDAYGYWAEADEAANESAKCVYVPLSA